MPWSYQTLILELIRDRQNGNHALMGHTEDPDPSHQAGIAGSIFTAVFVYIVRPLRSSMRMVL